MCPGGNVTLYSSCFAVMTLHYLGELTQLSGEKRTQWANYILKWQNPDDGYFLGPELVREEITSTKHDWDVVRMHLAVHVLPALNLLGVKPKYSLTFAHCFLDENYLKEWMNARDWKNAWLEGNNLLFIGQFLIHLRDVEHLPGAEESIDLYFKCLDEHIDPTTGLWGTSNDNSSRASAMYGAYHQLLMYFHEEHPIPFPKRLVDATLSVQEFDGGFSNTGKGGACEDVDAVSILVNMYQRHDYEQAKIRRALRKAFKSVLKRLNPEGGFVYRRGSSFSHMSIPRTRVPANIPHLFATWFGVHTIALLSEVLTDEATLARTWNFNNILSMGWHRKWDSHQQMLTEKHRRAERKVVYLLYDITKFERAANRKINLMVKTILKLIRKVVQPVRSTIERGLR